MFRIRAVWLQHAANLWLAIQASKDSWTAATCGWPSMVRVSKPSDIEDNLGPIRQTETRKNRNTRKGIVGRIWPEWLEDSEYATLLLWCFLLSYNYSGCRITFKIFVLLQAMKAGSAAALLPSSFHCRYVLTIVACLQQMLSLSPCFHPFQPRLCIQKHRIYRWTGCVLNDASGCWWTVLHSRKSLKCVSCIIIEKRTTSHVSLHFD